MKVVRSLAKLFALTTFVFAFVLLTGVAWAQQPHQDTCTMAFQGESYGFCDFKVVPRGKRLMIQEVDAGGCLEAGVKPYRIQIGSSELDGISHFFTATFMGPDPSGEDCFATHQETHLYVRSGHRPNCSIEVSPYSSSSYTCNLSGVLENAP